MIIVGIIMAIVAIALLDMAGLFKGPVKHKPLPQTLRWICPTDGGQCNDMMCDTMEDCLMAKARAQFAAATVTDWRSAFRGKGCE